MCLIALLTMCGMCIGLTIVLLFVGQAWVSAAKATPCSVSWWGVLAFVANAVLFLWETIMATVFWTFTC